MATSPVRTGNDVDGRDELAVLDRLVGVADAVGADDGDVLQLAGRLHRLNDTERHAVVVGVEPDDVGVLLDEVGRDIVRKLTIPVDGTLATTVKFGPSFASVSLKPAVRCTAA